MHSICNLSFMHPTKFLYFFTADPTTIISLFDKLANEIKSQFEYLEENTEKYKHFSVLIEKGIKKIYKDDSEDITSISYKIKYIDSTRFTASSISNLVDNLAEGIHKIKCKDFNFFLIQKVSMMI